MDLLKSDYFKKRLEVRAKALTKKFSLRVTFSKTTCTDGETIYITPTPLSSAKNTITKEEHSSSIPLPSEIEELIAMYALDIHEAAHIRYSSFEVLEKIKQIHSPKKREEVFSINNILEDSRVEMFISNSHPGTAEYLKFINNYMYALFKLRGKTDKEDLKKNPHTSFKMALGLYAAVGRAPEEYLQKGVGDLLEEVKPLIAKARNSIDPETPFEMAKKIYKQMIERLGPLPEASPYFDPLLKGEEHTYTTDSKTAEKNAKDDLKNKKLKEKLYLKKSSKSSSRDKNESKDSGAEGEDKKGQEEGERESFSVDEEDLFEEVSSDLKKAAKLQDSKQREVEIKDPRIKDDIEVMFPDVSDSDEGIYVKVVGEIMPIKKKLEKQLREILKAKTAINRGLRTGKIDSSRVIRASQGHEAIFYKKNMKSTDSIGFLLLVDESGSMSINSRCKYARKATILFSEILRSLKIRHMVVGFDTNGDTRLMIYRSFIDPLNKPNVAISEINARVDNRDGTAIRAVTEFLLRQRFSKKVLIVISDGVPVATEYYPPDSVIDTAKAVKEAKRKGIRIIGISIDPDADNYLHKIYPGRVVVSKLEELPKKLLRVVKREVVN